MPSSSSDLAIAFGNGRFVIAFENSNASPLNPGFFSVVDSPDGHAWSDRSDRSDLTQVEDYRPGLTFGGGKFIAILTRSAAPLSAGRFHPRLSNDGRTWSGLAGEGGNFDPANAATRPAVAFGSTP